MFSTETAKESPTTETRRPAPAQMELLRHPDRFVRRHIGPSGDDTRHMLNELGHSSLDALVDVAVPASIRLKRPLHLPSGRSEFGILNELRAIAAKNQIFHSFIGSLRSSRCFLQFPSTYRSACRACVGEVMISAW